MNLTINHYPNQSFRISLYNLSYTWKIDFQQSVTEKLREGEKLTNALAFKIFKQIKLKSDILSILTKRIVFIPLSIAITIFGFALPTTTIALSIIGITACGLGGGMFKISIPNHSNDFLTLLSQAYSDQSRRAVECIRDLELSQGEAVFIFT